MKPSTDREAITLVLEGITKAGCTITEVADDTWALDERTPVGDPLEAVELVCGVDEAYVFLHGPAGSEAHSGWIRFVLGNDPAEVVCDHTTNLAEWIDPIVDPWWSR